MTSNRSIAADYCLNCHMKLTTPFCGSCGQKAHFHADPHLHDVLHEAWHEFFHIDGKIFRTLKVLLTKPGFLTREFFNGRRQRYLPPIRLYLTMSVIYFVTAAMLGHNSHEAKQGKLKNGVNESVTDVAGDLEQALKEIKADTTGENLSGELEFFGRKFSLARGQPYVDALKAHPEEFKHLYASAYPKALFLLLPLFALLLQAAFFFRERYPQYLYFALHYHSALFAIATLLLFFNSKFMMLWLTGGAIYFVVSTRRVWGGTKKAAFARGAFVATFYSLFFLLALGGAGLYAILKLD